MNSITIEPINDCTEAVLNKHLRPIVKNKTKENMEIQENTKFVYIAALLAKSATYHF